ncbi:hypothetical protein ACOQFB_10540 [Anaeromyxobacter sp. Red801]|uniref:hypothetical protein n=1 Tax=Anaeromyxobacter sp. Red801 TaxID=3411632 RepID=UPI003B9E15EE
MTIRHLLVAALLVPAALVVSAQQDPFAPPSQKARERKRKPAVPPPSAAELGVPVYPGARFDGDISGGMSGPDQKIWVFFTDDAPAKVVAFYEQKTGKKATEWDREKYMIPLEGDPPMPEHGLTIETLAGNPLLGDKGKTVVSVMRLTKT